MAAVHRVLRTARSVLDRGERGAKLGQDGRMGSGEGEPCVAQFYYNWC